MTQRDLLCLCSKALKSPSEESKMVSAQLHFLCLLTLYLTCGYGEEGKFSGPLKPMTFSIFEGQEPSQVIFQFKTNPPAVTFELTGETDGIFKIEKDGLLYHTRALDRETRAVHHLQLAALDSHGAIVDGPVPITIEVKDINDNRPTFLQSKYEGSVRQNSRPGKPFMYVNATDLDDPATPNGQLFYQIVIQLPQINDVMYFQIDSKTGAISLTPEGSQELDPVKNPSYNLVVSVKDMGGQSENSFSDTTYVDISIRENIWKAPEPVEIRENSTDPHPIKITQVQWNDPGAQYSLVNKEKLSPQKPQAERKEEKKAAAPAPEEEMDECEQALAAEPKAKDPFAHLPKSTFVLDEFKRKYSNEDTLSVALPYFWEHFDKDGWSLWYAEYRFPEELTQTFMSCNLITGMFQRLDKLRKNAFASVILFGTNNSSSISGVWVFRGQELAFPLSPDWQVDYESYTWRKLDPGSEETQTLVREYFSWEGTFQHVGKAVNQGKIFK